jgi:hypothetical protein
VPMDFNSEVAVLSLVLSKSFIAYGGWIINFYILIVGEFSGGIGADSGWGGSCCLLSCGHAFFYFVLTHDPIDNYLNA